MSIRPVDMQIMVQKIPDAGKAEHVESQRPQIQQHTLVERTTREALLNEERVAKSEQTEQEGVKEDGKGGVGYKHRGKRKRPSTPEKSSEEQGSGGEHGMFDISI